MFSKNSFDFELFKKRLWRYIKNLDNISIVWYIGLFVVLLFIGHLIKFTLVYHDFYKKLADWQQKITIQNPSSRGSITSSESSLAGVVSVSTNLGTLAIDPTQTGSTSKMLEFLSDAVLTEFCEMNITLECRQKIANYVKDETNSTNTDNRDALKEKIEKFLEQRMNAPIESVYITEINSDEILSKINALEEKSLFFVVNNLYVNPTLVTDWTALAGKLSEILWMEKEKIEPKFAIRKKRYLEVIRKMSVRTRDMVSDFLKKNQETTRTYLAEIPRNLDPSLKIQEREKILLEHAVYPFVTIADNFTRYYPEGATLGQITGFVDGEGVGRYGVEGYFDKILQGANPTQVVTKDNHWRFIRDYDSNEELFNNNATQISLTIDRNIQKEVSKRLEKAVARFQANRGSVIIMNPKTGAVTAMVNYPNYDPNQFTDIYALEPILYSEYPRPASDLFGFPMFVIDTENGNITQNIDGKRVKMREATEEEISNAAIQKFKYKNGYGIGNYQNPVISSLYEPGSVFKAITVAIGLDTGEIRPNDVYYDKNYVELDIGGTKRRISNLAKSSCGGRHTYINALNWSCNVGMINIIEKVGRSLFDSYIRDFGFGSKAGITLDGEVFGHIPPYEKWSRMQFFTMSFGQGINMTMLQMAAAYNVLANGGVYMQPYILESVTYPDGRKIVTPPTQIRRVIKEDTSKAITAMLVDGVKNGFAKAGAVPGYVMAGKTGTSQIPYKGTYENIYFNQVSGHTVTSYGWYAPAYNPKFVMIVVIERPRTSPYAEQTAAALYAEIAEYLLTYYKVPKWQ